MSNWIEKLFNAPVEEVADPNDVDVLNQEQYEAVPAVPNVWTTEDLPALHMVIDETVVTQERPSNGVTMTQHVQAQNAIVQLGNYNRFRTRYFVSAEEIDQWRLCHSYENAQAGVGIIVPVSGVEIRTAAPLWALKHGATATSELSVVQEFVDG